MKKKIILIIASIMIVLGTALIVNSNYKTVKADPGFDSSFDSGGSSSGSDSDSNSDGSTRVLVFFIVVFFALFFIGSSRGVYPLSDDIIHQKLGNDFDVEHFKKFIFETYKEVCICWMNNDTDSLKKYLTNEMYNMYKTQLLTLSSKNQQNVMEDITCLESEIIQVNILDNTVEIDTMLHVTCKDYIIDAVTNEVVRGNKDKINDYTYQITFVSDTGVESIEKCPSCGANFDDNNTTVCPYCRKVFVKKSTKFLMSKKEMVNQQ